MEIKLKDIKVLPERGRTNFGDITSLAESMKRLGQLHPIVVQNDKENPGKFILIAGERRIRAYLISGIDSIKATLFENVDGLTHKEIELEENIIRKDLTTYEQCELLAQLDDIKRKKYGSGTRNQRNEGWTLQNTAEAVGKSIGAVTQDINIAKAIRKDPNLIKKIGHLPKHAARKFIKRAEEAKDLQEKIANHKLLITTDLRFGPAEELIKELDNESINLVITDPPYAIAQIASAGSTGYKTMTYALTKSNVSDENKMMIVYDTLLPELYKKMIPGAHFYMFFAHGWYCRLQALFKKYGFIFGEVPIIWNKMRPSMVGKSKYYTPSFEAIMFGRKPPESRLLAKPLSDVISIQAIAPQMRIHSMQKSPELLELLIKQSSLEGETVLDCFAGSGQTLVSAKALGRKAIGFEIDEENYLLAQNYLSKQEIVNV